jgi:hypothetical protein
MAIMRGRRWAVSIALSAGALALILFSVAVVMAVANPAPGPASVPTSHTLASIHRIRAQPLTLQPATQVPVLVYHEMNNGCKPSARTCRSASDYETVSYRQFYNEMAYMHRHGYHTITIGQYLQWLRSPALPLPSHPFLITVDNGIGNFLEGAQPVLYHFRYTATAFLVTGFADGASGHCAPHGPNGVNLQPGCPKANHGWDLPWSELRALSPAVYSFALEAGSSGHFQQTYNHACNAFYACRLPGETMAQYTLRVFNEMNAAVRELANQLGTRYNQHAWVVPYSDLGYPCRITCAYEHYTGPDNWLIRFAARNFQAVFVQDYYRNGMHHERFRYEVQHDTTLPKFRTAIRHYLSIGAWK